MLTFPTQAEQCLAEWRACTTTTPLETITKRFNAFRDDESTTIVWVFEDSTTIHCSGRGASYKATAELP